MKLSRNLTIGSSVLNPHLAIYSFGPTNYLTVGRVPLTKFAESSYKRNNFIGGVKKKKNHKTDLSDPFRTVPTVNNRVLQYGYGY